MLGEEATAWEATGGEGLRETLGEKGRGKEMEKDGEEGEGEGLEEVCVGRCVVCRGGGECVRGGGIRASWLVGA